MLGSLLHFISRFNSTPYFMPEMHSVGGIDISQVSYARRRAHRGKMYRRYRNQRLAGKLAHRYAK